jgi:HEXXH motif-containing protein
VRVQCLHGALSGESPAPAERIDAWIADLCAATLFELALCRRLPDDGVRIDRPIARLTSVAHRLSLAFDPPPRAIRFAPGRLDLETPRGSAEVPLRGEPPPGATASRPFHAIDDGAVLALVDSNPLALIEAHPEKHGNAVDLGGHPVEEWVSTLRGAIDLVARYLPGIRQEMRLLLQEVVPVGYDPERHLSASYREAVGLVYLSLHPNLLTMTEALIHEFQHNKLNMLWTLAPLLENAFSPLFRSPVRPDPRPLHGVLLAVHAFQPVARLYEEMDRAGDPRLRSPDVRRRYAQVIAQNREACEVLLPSSQATDAGRALLEEIARWDAHYASIRV